jgi:hypothetical protein
MVVCLLLAVETNKAIRLHSHSQALQHHQELDKDWEDTLQATEIDDKELNQQTSGQFASEPTAKQNETKAADTTAVQTASALNIDKKKKKMEEKKRRLE